MDEAAGRIPFEWVVQPSSVDELAAALHAAGIEPGRRAATPRDFDTQIYTLLEEAGLMFDQQQSSQLAEGATEVFTAAASPEALGSALFHFTEERGTGGVVVDLLTTPAQITEVRHINGEILVLADREGARQLHLRPEAIASSLRRALSGRPA